MISTHEHRGVSDVVEENQALPGRYLISPEDRARSHSPGAKAKRAATRRRQAGLKREYIADLRNWGMVLGAIADAVGLSEATVVKIVRELEVEGLVERRPRYGRGVIESS